MEDRRQERDFLAHAMGKPAYRLVETLGQTQTHRQLVGSRARQPRIERQLVKQ